jgi:predicted nucleic acid-binding protein
MKLKLYLDSCVYNRPFDFQGQERVALETSAFIYLIDKIEKENYTVIVSEALIYENDINPDEERKNRISSYFKLANEFVKVDDSDLERVKSLKKYGFSDMDALHITLAEKCKVDYFLTCDDEIVRLYKNHRDSIKVKVSGLIEFIAKEKK